jgi:hypothetical protein
VDPRAGMDDMEKTLTLSRLQLRSLGRPARSQSLSRLHNPFARNELENAVSNSIRCGENVFTESLPRNSCGTFACLAVGAQ